MDGAGGYQVSLPYFPDRHLVVDFSPDKYARRPHPDKALEASIDQTWHRVTSRNPSLFNGTKFRLAGLHVAPDETCTLQMALTDYKTFQGTHSPPDPLKRFGPQHMALPLGNVIVVETSDQKTVVLVRNASVGEGRGFSVFPGGHPEPSALTPPPCEGDARRVRGELWQGARREVLEELFLWDGHVQKVDDITLLGIVARRSDAKASMIFFAKVFLTGAEVVSKYLEGNVHEEESVRMILLPIKQLRELTRGGMIEGNLVPMPELVGAAELWMQMKDWRKD